MSDDEEPELLTLSHMLGRPAKKKKVARNEFINDEAELSGDDVVSDEEDDFSDDDRIDADLAEIESPDSDSGEEREEEGEKKEAELLTLDHLKGLPAKKRKMAKSEFIDDEAELSGDDVVSEDEDDRSDDDQIDLDLVDLEAPELDSDEEEAVRGLYHKQLESEDKRAVLLLQEQLEDKDVGVGQRRRRKFRWQTKELMENSLKRHYDPDDDDSQGSDDDEDDDVDYSELETRLRRPTADALLIGSARITSRLESNSATSPLPLFGGAGSSRSAGLQVGPSALGFSDDSNSNAMSSNRPIAGTSKSTSSNPITDINRFLFRDKELVQALSTKETVILTREEKDRIIQREIKRVQQSKSIFDQLYG